MLKMNFSLSLFSFFLLFYSVNAFNITKILSQYSDFSTFNDYLTETQLAGVINSRQTITILAVANDAMSSVSGKPKELLKNIMSVHVVLDYYDDKKLQKLPNKTDILTTLFQSSGQATGQQGFLNVTDTESGSVAIGSAVKGATLGANLVRSVTSQPYNISVLEISSAIIPTGIENSKTNSSSKPTSPPAPSPKKSPSPSPKKSPGPSPHKAKAPSPSDAPTADAPGSPPKPDAPTADAPVADAPNADNNRSPSAGTALRVRLAVAVMIIVSSTSFLTAKI